MLPHSRTPVNTKRNEDGEAEDGVGGGGGDDDVGDGGGDDDTEGGGGLLLLLGGGWSLMLCVNTKVSEAPNAPPE